MDEEDLAILLYAALSVPFDLIPSLTAARLPSIKRLTATQVSNRIPNIIKGIAPGYTLRTKRQWNRDEVVRLIKKQYDRGVAAFCGRWMLTKEEEKAVDVSFSTCLYFHTLY